MKKRGIFFSTDAFVALSIIFLTVIIAFPISKEIKRESYLQYDLIQTLDSLKVGELAGTPSHLITDPNQSLLEQIGEFYTQGKLDEAKELAGIALANLDTSQNIGLWYDDELIFSVYSTPYESARNVRTARQLISGIGAGNQTTGFVAKAWLENIQSKDTSLVVRGDFICGGGGNYSWGQHCGNKKTPNNF